MQQHIKFVSKNRNVVLSLSNKSAGTIDIEETSMSMAGTLSTTKYCELGRPKTSHQPTNLADANPNPVHIGLD